MCAKYWKLLLKETRNIQERMSKYCHIEMVVLPWKQLKFTKYIGFRNLESETYCCQVSSLYVPQTRNNQINQC